MKEFWKNKPVIIKKDVEEIVKLEDLQNMVCSEIETDKLQLDYEILDSGNKEHLNFICNFLNTHYNSGKTSRSVQYSTNLISYFLTDPSDNICLVFYPRGKRKAVGFICGVKRNIVINMQEYTCLEVNFLCIIKSLRKMHVSSFMINCVTKESLKRGIKYAFYTIQDNVKKDHFSLKYYYHRPLNIKLLIDTEMISNEYTVDDLIGYNYFEYNTDNKILVLLQKQDITDDLVDKLYINLNNYEKHQFSIYNKISKRNFKELLLNNYVYSFVLQNTGGEITDLVIFYRLDNIHDKSGKITKTGYLYKFFFEMKCINKNENDNNHISSILERINAFVYKQKMFDLMTVLDPFGLTEDMYFSMKYLQGTSKLHYYIYNLSIPFISSDKNGLVTI